MASSETLFNPSNDSLAERVKAYSTVCRDYTRVKASLRLVSKGEGIDYIGDAEQVQSAYELVNQSLKEASLRVSASDIEKANKQGLVNKSEFADMMQYQRQAEMTTKRNQQKANNSHSFKKT